MRLYKIKILIRYLLLLRRYFNFISSFVNFLMIVWIAPMDCKSVFDLFINLVDEDPSNAKTKEMTENEKSKQWLLDAFFVVCFVIGLYIWYKSTNIGGGVNDVSIHSDDSSSSSEISILSDAFVKSQNVKDGAGPIISKHW